LPSFDEIENIIIPYDEGDGEAASTDIWSLMDLASFEGTAAGN